MLIVCLIEECIMKPSPNTDQDKKPHFSLMSEYHLLDVWVAYINKCFKAQSFGTYLVGSNEYSIFYIRSESHRVASRFSISKND